MVNADPERRYTDEEVAKVLHRAVQPVSGGQNLPTRSESEGITLAQLESVAAEAGIDPARVRKAALTMGDAPLTEGGSRLFGPRTMHVFDRVVEGEMPPQRLSDLIAAMRRLMRQTGKVEQIGDWLEWTSDAGIIHVTVKPENGRTQLQFMGNAGPKMIGVLAPTALATLISIVTLGHEGMLGIGPVSVIVGAAFTVARGAWEVVGRRARAKYQRIADQLATEVERLTNRGGAE